MSNDDFSDYMHRSWVEIDADNLAYNIKQAKSLTHQNCKMLAILKADAYGHGAVETAKIFADNGADYFGVAAANEALQLRDAGIKTPVLLLGIANVKDVDKLAEKNITLTVNNIETARRFSAASRRKLKVHIKIDTGMTRLGIRAFSNVDAAVDEALAISKLPNIEVEGVFSHLCVADNDSEEEFTLKQIAVFEETCKKIEQAGLKIQIRHCAAAPGMLKYKQAHFDMVRPGLIIYGLMPANAAQYAEMFRPAFTFRSTVAQVSNIEQGDKIGYGRTWEAPRKSRIATVNFGYADGIPRTCSGKISAIIKGHIVRQVGTLCMDMCMFDITDFDDITAGDIATVVGSADGLTLPAENIAKAANTITHEVLTGIGLRVPKVYFKNGRPFAVTSYVGF